MATIHFVLGKTKEIFKTTETTSNDVPCITDNGDMSEYLYQQVVSTSWDINKKLEQSKQEDK